MSDEADERNLLRRRRRERAKTADYQTGYAKPPRDHQFKPGNKMAARLRKKKNRPTMPELLEKVGREKVSINRNGRPVKMTRDELILRALYNEASSRHLPSQKMWSDLQRRWAPQVPTNGRDEEAGIDYGELVRQKLDDMAERQRELELIERGAVDESDQGSREGKESDPDDAEGGR